MGAVTIAVATMATSYHRVPSSDILSQSNWVFVGEVTGLQVNQGTVVHRFEVLRTYRGSVDLDEVTVETNWWGHLPSCLGDQVLVAAVEHDGAVTYTSTVYGVIPVEPDGGEWWIAAFSFRMRFNDPIKTDWLDVAELIGE